MSAPPSHPRSTFRTSDGCEISFTLQPSKSQNAPRIVLVHSLALGAQIWDGVVERLAPRADILTYDCRGHGRSDRRGGSYTTELFARDLAELLDHVGWESATIAGCSMGGCVAQAFAGLYPQRVTSLGLIDTTAWYGPEAPRQWRERAAEASAKGFEAMIGFQVARWFSDAFRATHGDVVKAVSDLFVANDPNCYAATCVMLGDADLRPYLKSLRMPVAIVVGEEDYATPVAAAKSIQDAVPHATLAVLAGGRHLTPVERPDEISAELSRILRPS